MTALILPFSFEFAKTCVLVRSRLASCRVPSCCFAVTCLSPVLVWVSLLFILVCSYHLPGLVCYDFTLRVLTCVETLERWLFVTHASIILAAIRPRSSLRMHACYGYGFGVCSGYFWWCISFTCGVIHSVLVRIYYSYYDFYFNTTPLFYFYSWLWSFTYKLRCFSLESWSFYHDPEGDNILHEFGFGGFFFYPTSCLTFVLLYLYMFHDEPASSKFVWDFSSYPAFSMILTTIML